jgi:putative hemolysin
MDALWLQLALIVVLVAINAVLSGSEIALISLREPQLARLDARGGTGSVVAELAREPNRFLSTIQIGITLAGFMASAVAAVSLAQPIVSWFSWAGDADETLAIITVTLVLSFVTLVFGELAPKRLALQKPEQWAMATGRVLHGFSVVMTPVVWLLSVSTDAVVRVFGGTPGASREEVDIEELKDMILANAKLSEDHHEVLLGAVELVERNVGQVMTPRLDVRAVASDVRIESAQAEMIASGFSRLPVVDEDGGLDTALGVVTLQDVVAADPQAPVRTLVKDAPALPESAPVLVALRTLQDVRQQLAFVVDEHGGIEGIVTVEDLVEEMVGEIYDEYDQDVATARRDRDGSYIIPGRFPVHDLVDLGIEVPSGDYTTVGGLVLATAGEVPAEGDTALVDGWEITVLSVEDNAVESVRFVETTPEA